MIIKFAPTIELKTIFRAISRNLFSYGENYLINNTSFYSRATWALYDSIIESLSSKGKTKGAVWFPDYFCNEPLIPLRNKGINLCFYPITKDLTPDWIYIENELKGGFSPDVFILVHYFGFISPLKKAIKFSKEYNMTLIEDGAHLLRQKTTLLSDYSIYSPRKLFALPELGILVSKSNRTTSKINFRLFNFTFIIWILKSLIHHVLSKLNINWNLYNLKNNKQKAVTINSNKYPSRLCLKLYIQNYKNIDLYSTKRVENYLALHKCIVKMNNIKPLFNKLPKDNIPYVFPIIINEKYNIVKIELVKIGIAVTSWNDMPPEIEKSFKLYDFAIHLSKSLLLIPIHHSIGINQINFMANSLSKIIKDIND